MKKVYVCVYRTSSYGVYKSRVFDNSDLLFKFNYRMARRFKYFEHTFFPIWVA